MARYDIEQYVEDVISALQSVLNTNINAINTDKGDSLLSTVSSTAYYFKKDSVSNKADSPFVYYEPYETVSIDNNTDMRGLVEPSKSYQMEWGIGFRNNLRYVGTDLENFKRVMRYQKAFEESLVQVNQKVRGYGQVELLEVKSSVSERDENLLHSSGFLLEITVGG